MLLVLVEGDGVVVVVAVVPVGRVWGSIAADMLCVACFVRYWADSKQCIVSREEQMAVSLYLRMYLHVDGDFAEFDTSMLHSRYRDRGGFALFIHVCHGW